MRSTEVIIRLASPFTQKIGNIQRVIGLMPAKYLVPLIDSLDLDANPRNSKIGSVTEAIQSSVRDDELAGPNKLFPFKSKGILLASSQFEALDRNRYRLTFTPHDSIEGILDGGHNTLAIGSYILDNALHACNKRSLKKAQVSIWEKFKETWQDNRADIGDYLQMIRDEKNSPVDAGDRDGAHPTLGERGIGMLDFQIPLELLLPVDPEDELCVESFRNSLLEICDARNNNAQLTAGTKGNQEGLFDTFKNLFAEKEPLLADQISWKTNDGKPVPSRTLVALAWVPLSLISSSVTDGEIEPPILSAIYSGKEKCQEKYLQLMRNTNVSKEVGARRELTNPQIESALEIAVDMPKLFDTIYELFPGYYNRTGSYGRIGAVKSLKNTRDEYATPFFEKKVGNPVPDGFVYPLVCGLRALMGVDENGRVHWEHDPFEFLASDAFRNVVEKFSGVIQQSEYDPQKVGKGAYSYTAAEDSMKLAVLAIK